jgi:hypothetical protein
MTVAKNKEGRGGVVVKILLGKDYQGFVDLTLEGLFGFYVA